jgi:hypothetical protein
MAGKEKPDTDPKQLKQDRLVEQLVPDPGDLQPRIQLTGWLGKGPKEGSWRLYLTPQLDEYVQFSDKDVVHTQSVQPEQSPLGGTTVWLQKGTVLQHTQVVTRQVQADFLSGGITAGFMRGTVSSLPLDVRARQAALGTGGFVCSINPHIPVCRPPTEGCTVACGSGFCHTHEFVCGL